MSLYVCMIAQAMNREACACGGKSPKVTRVQLGQQPQITAICAGLLLANPALWTANEVTCS